MLKNTGKVGKFLKMKKVGTMSVNVILESLFCNHKVNKKFLEQKSSWYVQYKFSISCEIEDLKSNFQVLPKSGVSESLTLCQSTVPKMRCDGREVRRQLRAGNNKPSAIYTVNSVKKLEFWRPTTVISEKIICSSLKASYFTFYWDKLWYGNIYCNPIWKFKSLGRNLLAYTF